MTDEQIHKIVTDGKYVMCLSGMGCFLLESGTEHFVTTAQFEAIWPVIKEQMPSLEKCLR